MHGTRFALILALTCCLVQPALAQDGAQVFELESAAVGCTYQVEVVLPAGEHPPDAKFPVAYCMDWYILGDYLKSLPRLMSLGNLAEPYILVGISQGDSVADWAAMRTRDFTPAQPSDEYTKGAMYAPAVDQCGGARNFTAFLRDELIPSIEEQFPADPARRCFAGYSLGALLGVQLLEQEPQLFQDYILGSPSLWFNDYYLADALADFSAEDPLQAGRVYVSVGEEESWDMLRSYDSVRSALAKAGVESLEYKAEIIDAAGHVGAMPISLYNGFRFVFASE